MTTDQLLRQEFEERKRRLKKLLDDWGKNMRLFDRNTKQTVLDAVNEIWELRLVNEKKNVCTHLIYLVRDDIDNGYIAADTIRQHCPVEFKRPLGGRGTIGRRRRRTQNPISFRERDLTNVMTHLIDILSGISSDVALKMPPSQVILEAKNHMRRIVLPWSEDQLIITAQALVHLNPLMKAFEQMLRDEIESRKAKEKLLSR